MKATIRRACLIALLMPALAGAQLGGTWDIMASFNFMQEVSCEYSGTGQLIQGTDQVSGPISLTLVNGDAQLCPGEMIGELSATVNTDNSFTGSVDGSQDPAMLGVATVSGTVVPAPTASNPAAKAVATSMRGTSSTQGGSFPGSTGSFSGSLRPVIAPALDSLALAALAALLLGGSTLLLVRRRPSS